MYSLGKKDGSFAARQWAGYTAPAMVPDSKLVEFYTRLSGVTPGYLIRPVFRTQDADGPDHQFPARDKTRWTLVHRFFFVSGHA